MSSSSVDDGGGYRLVDRRGRVVGQVNDVIRNGNGGRATWFVVGAGLFRGRHHVPALGAYHTDDRNIVVPFTAAQIRSAPRIRGRAVAVGPGLHARLSSHYGLVL